MHIDDGGGIGLGGIGLGGIGIGGGGGNERT